MDEVPLQFESSGYTYDFGKFVFCQQRTINQDSRITSDGLHLSPMAIFKGRTHLNKNLKDLFDKHALLCINLRGWITNANMKIWINKILANFAREPTTKYFVVLDQFFAHISMETKDELEKHCFGFVTPGGCPGLRLNSLP